MDLSSGWGSPAELGILMFGLAAVLWAISKLVQSKGGDDSKDE